MAGTSRVDHVVLTRFNLPNGGVEGLIRAREGWLRDRVALFERYTVPSMLAQTRRPHWIVYVDPESPAWLLERTSTWRESGVLTPVFRPSVSREELEADLRAVVGTPGEVLLTTNLDNDDGLAVDFCERVVAAGGPPPRAAVYVTRGLVVSPDGVFLRRDRRNAFCSVRETWDGPVTAWSEYHNELARVMPTVEVGGGPGWLQVVHGANVSNRVRGRLVSPAPWRTRFPGLEDATEPARSELLRDRLLLGPARLARDSARAGLRTAGLRVLGKERYGAAKGGLRTVLSGLRGRRREKVAA